MPVIRYFISGASATSRDAVPGYAAGKRFSGAARTCDDDAGTYQVAFRTGAAIHHSGIQILLVRGLFLPAPPPLAGLPAANLCRSLRYPNADKAGEPGGLTGHYCPQKAELPRSTLVKYCNDCGLRQRRKTQMELAGSPGMRAVALLLAWFCALPATAVCLVRGHSWVHVARGLPLMQCARCDGSS